MNGDKLEVFEVKEFNTEYVSDINRLLRQLSSAAYVVTEEKFRSIIVARNTHLFLLTVDGRVAGMCTLAVYSVLTGMKAWIEDVVVDEAFRGQHLGKRLVEYAVDFARKMGECSIMLTSRPSRGVANNLYKSVGFVQRDTNVYRMKILDEKNC